MTIDTTRQIAQMPIISLSGVDCLRGKGLRCVLDAIFRSIYAAFWRRVDFGAETLTG
jgi:hypothetical protein